MLEYFFKKLTKFLINRYRSIKELQANLELFSKIVNIFLSKNNYIDIRYIL